MGHRQNYKKIYKIFWADIIIKIEHNQNQNLQDAAKALVSGKHNIKYTK